MSRQFSFFLMLFGGILFVQNGVAVICFDTKTVFAADYNDYVDGDEAKKYVKAAWFLDSDDKLCVKVKVELRQVIGVLRKTFIMSIDEFKALMPGYPLEDSVVDAGLKRLQDLSCRVKLLADEYTKALVAGVDDENIKEDLDIAQKDLNSAVSARDESLENKQFMAIPLVNADDQLLGYKNFFALRKIIKVQRS